MVLGGSAKPLLPKSPIIIDHDEDRNNLSSSDEGNDDKNTKNFPPLLALYSDQIIPSTKSSINRGLTKLDDHSTTLPDRQSINKSSITLFSLDPNLRLALPHFFLILAIVAYILAGAAVFRGLEKPNELEHQRFMSYKVRDERDAIAYRIFNASQRRDLKDWQIQLEIRKGLHNYKTSLMDAIDNGFVVSGQEEWSYPAAVLFAFSVVTTIGYGNIVPQTSGGRIFTMIYALAGIPITMLGLANMGKFLAEGMDVALIPIRRLVPYVIRKVKVFAIKISGISYADLKSLKGVGEMDEEDEGPGWLAEGTTPLPFLLLLIILYLFVGAAIMPYWEPQMNYLSGLYFLFITITTTGLGDLVPESMPFLPMTLLYISMGVAITTLSIELAGDYMRKVHYAGRAITRTRHAKINIGGKSMTVGDLVEGLGNRFGVPPEKVRELIHSGLDELVQEKIEEVENPAPPSSSSSSTTTIQTPIVPSPKSSPSTSSTSSSTKTNSANSSPTFLSSISRLSPMLMDLTGPLRRLLGPFAPSLSDDDIRYIDDNRKVTNV